jgi:hypothetical protein
MSILIGEAGITEPMWFYLSFMRRVHHEKQFIEHAIDIRDHRPHSDHPGIATVSRLADDRRERRSRDTAGGKISPRN